MHDDYEALVRDIRKLEQRIDRYLTRLADRQVLSQQRIQNLEIEIISRHAEIDDGAERASFLQSALAALKSALGKAA